MAHREQQNFCDRVKKIYPSYFKNKTVLDIGSLDINGSNNRLFEDCNYIGLDVGEGNNVDVVCVGHLYDAPDNYFDVIISTEVFEHDMYYEKTIANIIRMLKPGGLFLFTCASTGRPEHGTRRCGEYAAPLLLQISEQWADYYKNLTSDDIKQIPNFNINFPDGIFELNNIHLDIPADLYFYGIKGGSKYHIDNIVPEYGKDQFPDDIFVIDYWINNEPKENDLVNLIKILKTYNIPILLTGHHPLKEEIQRMVDYYLYDKNNPILVYSEFDSMDVGSGRWTDMGSFRIDNKYEFHHDYAIWETMRNAFHFCNYLGKKNIHFFEYDNLPNAYQYRQSFLEQINKYDLVLYEYHKESTIDKHLSPYCATYIFSIKTDIALKTIDLIKTKEDYFTNKPTGWQLERVFLDCVKKVTNNTFVTKYIANDNELNTQAVWSRDGLNRNGGTFQIYLATDDDDNLYIHLISGFHEKKADSDYIIEVEYREHKKFYNLPIEGYVTELIGKYAKGYRVKAYFMGVEVYSEFLKTNSDIFKSLNKLTNKMELNKNNNKPITVNVNFINGAFAEILGNNNNKYTVKFIDGNTNKIIHQDILKCNTWAKTNRKYYTNWIIQIIGNDDDYFYEHIFNPENKKMLISVDSESLGDSLAWMGQIEAFRIKHNCKVVCSTFQNILFSDQYPEIQFVAPGSIVDNIYGQFYLGYYYINDNVDYDRHLLDPKKEPLMKVCSDILGLDYVEIKPKLKKFNVKRQKKVAIGFHSTAQCKYWNNPTGWLQISMYLNALGYEVVSLSQEETGYMGNYLPENIKQAKKGSIETMIKYLQESEIFIGISSGLSWLSWATETPTIIISGFTDVFNEPTIDVHRVINKKVCNSCWSNVKFDAGDWNWCPLHKGTQRQFECSKAITADMVIEKIKLIFEQNK
jgi:autotransporter strand-loop-strand O-heptosyltransferase